MALSHPGSREQRAKERRARWFSRTPRGLDATVYPRTYSASIGWRVSHSVTHLALGVGGVIGAWYFGTGHEIPNIGQPPFAVATSVAMAILGFWSAIGRLLAKTVVLTPDELQIRGIFATKTLTRAYMTGCRISATGALVVESRAPDGSKTHTKVSIFFEPDRAFADWFKGIPDLKEMDESDSDRAIEQDVRLGSSRKERWNTFHLASDLKDRLGFVTFGALFWAFLFPSPYIVLATFLLVLPWMAIWIYWRNEGHYSLAFNKHDARADLWVQLLMPGWALALFALRPAFVDLTELVVPALIVLVVIVTCIGYARPADQIASVNLKVLALLLCPYAVGSVAVANRVYDTNTARTYLLEVLDKKKRAGVFVPSYSLRVSDWGPHPEIDEVPASEGVYREADGGRQVCLQLHPGALGIEWYEVRSLDECRF